MPLVTVMPYIDQCNTKFKDNNKEHSKDKESAAILVQYHIWKMNTYWLSLKTVFQAFH